MSEDIVKESIKCLANMEIKETTYQVARSVVLDEIERLHTIIKEVREYIEENTYKIEWGDLEEDNEDINISEDITDKEFIESLLEILDKEIK